MGNANAVDVQLYRAARIGDGPAMSEALKNGANPNWVAPQHGWTSLHVSAEYRQVAACRLLLASGADPGIEDKNGVTPAELAKRRGIELAELRVAVAPQGSGSTHSKLEPASTQLEEPELNTVENQAAGEGVEAEPVPTEQTSEEQEQEQAEVNSAVATLDEPAAGENTAEFSVTAHQMQLLDDLFDVLDFNKDNSVARSELIKAINNHTETLAPILQLEARTIAESDGSRAAFERVFASIDADGSKYVSKEEWSAYFDANMPALDAIKDASHELVPDSEEYKLLQYDKDGDGQLDEDERKLMEIKMITDQNTSIPHDDKSLPGLRNTADEFDIKKHHGTYEGVAVGYGWKLVMTSDSKFTMTKFDGDLTGPEGTDMDAPSSGQLDFEAGEPFENGQQCMVVTTKIGDQTMELKIPAAFGFVNNTLIFKMMQASKVMEGAEPKLPSDLDEEDGHDVVTLHLQ